MPLRTGFLGLLAVALLLALSMTPVAESQAAPPTPQPLICRGFRYPNWQGPDFNGYVNYLRSPPLDIRGQLGWETLGSVICGPNAAVRLTISNGVILQVAREADPARTVAAGFGDGTTITHMEIVEIDTGRCDRNTCCFGSCRHELVQANGFFTLGIHQAICVNSHHCGDCDCGYENGWGRIASLF